MLDSLDILVFLIHLKKIKINFCRYNSKFKNRYDTLKLHLGCGTRYKNGWINIDNNSDKNIAKLDVKYDLSRGIPFDNDSVDYIYNEHFLEHLTVDEGKYFLQECRRVLKKGGILRIAMTDLADLLKSYFNENWKRDSAEFFKKFNLTYIQTRAEYLNINFHNWGHKWLYDREELERRLKETGFKEIKFCNLHESEHTELCNLETRQESDLIAEVIKEC